MQTNAQLRPNVAGTAPWYSHRWPWLLMLGPFIVVIAGIFTGWIAFSQQDALVVDDYYKQGKAINQDLRRDRHAAKLHLNFRAKYDAAAGRLSGTIHSFDKPLTTAFQIRLVHSTLPEKDAQFEAQSDNHGNFTIALPMLEKARWQILVQDKSREWRLSGILAWPQQRELEMRADDMAPLD